MEEEVVECSCGCKEPRVYVHGHYQCVKCHRVCDGDCCQGEQASE